MIKGNRIKGKSRIGEETEDIALKRQLMRKALYILYIIIILSGMKAVAFSYTDERKNIMKSEAAIPEQTLKLAPRISSLEGKCVVLRWNGRPNGDIFLNRISELLTSKIKTINIKKAYEVEPKTASISYSLKGCKEIAGRIASLNPDIVIAAQAD